MKNDNTTPVVKAWIDNYANWIKQKYKIIEFKNGNELTTPFTNAIGDNIRIYIINMSNKSIRLTDDGNTFNDLDMMGIDLSNNTRNQIIQSILKQYGISKDSDDILYIDDLFYTRKAITTNIFKEEVLNFFIENDFGGLPEYDIYGSSGIPYKIDYALGMKKSKPWRFFQIINRPNFEAIAYQNLIFDDIKKNSNFGESSIQYILILNTKNSKPNSKSKKLSETYGTELISWNNKNDLLKMR